MRLESTLELCFGPTKGGHYNEVVLLKRWPLSEVLLYYQKTTRSHKTNSDNGGPWIIEVRIRKVLLYATTKKLNKINIVKVNVKMK